MDRFPPSKAPVKRVKGVQFSIWDPDEIVSGRLRDAGWGGGGGAAHVRMAPHACPHAATSACAAAAVRTIALRDEIKHKDLEWLLRGVLVAPAQGGASLQGVVYNRAGMAPKRALHCM